MRCECSNWDHPTHGLEKCETPEYELVVAQDKEASRELEYHKFKSTDNSADSVRRHTETMRCAFVFGRDPMAFSVNNLSANVSMEKAAMEMDEWTPGHAQTYIAKLARPQTKKGRPGNIKWSTSRVMWWRSIAKFDLQRNHVQRLRE